MTETLTHAAILFSAILPPLIITLYFAVGAGVRPQSSPIWTCFGLMLLASAMVLSAVIVLRPLVLEHVPAGQLGIARAFILAAVPEETAKLATFLMVIWRYRRKLSASQLVALGVATSCGFACIENIFFLFVEGNWGLRAAVRAVSAVPGHAFVGAVMGYALYRAIHGPSRWMWYALCLLGPIILHGAYNTPLLTIVASMDANVHVSKDETVNMVILFLIIVLVEGVLAHLCLLGASREPKTDLWIMEESPLDAIGDRVFAWFETPLFWALITVCVFGLALSMPFIFQASIPRDFGIMSSGLAPLVIGTVALGLLHTAVFIRLAVTLGKRRRDTN